VPGLLPMRIALSKLADGARVQSGGLVARFQQWIEVPILAIDSFGQRLDNGLRFLAIGAPIVRNRYSRPLLT